MTVQRQVQHRDLDAHAAPCHVRQRGWVALAGDQSLQHLAARHPEYVGDDRLQLQAGVLQVLPRNGSTPVTAEGNANSTAPGIDQELVVATGAGRGAG